ncbi:MAG: RNA chaperone Hfq [Lautropia sp.]
MTEPDDSPVTADPADTRPPGPKNEQFASLNRLRRERTWVDVYLIGGTCLHGQIRSFDASMMLLQTRGGDIALYHHAISTVVRAQKRGPSKRGRRPGGYESPRPPRSVPRVDARIDPRPDPVLPEPGDDPEPPRRPADRPPVVIVKQRKTRTFVKPD